MNIFYLYVCKRKLKVYSKCDKKNENRYYLPQHASSLHDYNNTFCDLLQIRVEINSEHRRKKKHDDKKKMVSRLLNV